MKLAFKFKNFYTLLPLHKKTIDSDFLSWFIGFFEGDGHFCSDGRVKITQSSRDIQVLYRLKTTLGFGVVRKQCFESNTHC